MAQTATNPKIEELRFRLKTDPKSRLFYQLAEELRKAGHTGEAEQVLRSGLTVYPTYLAAWVSLGRVLREQKNDGAAVEALTKAMQLDPGNVVAARLLADAYRNLGENVEAIKKYKLVLALMPGDEELKATIEQLDREITGPLGGPPASPPAVSGGVPPPPPESGGEDAATTAAETAAVPMAEESPFDRTAPPFDEAIETGDVEPMLVAHDDSPFEEPATLAAAIEIEQPMGMHIDVAPLAAEVPAPVVDEADVFEPAVVEPPPQVEDLTNTLTMADLYARQGLTNDARHIYENILARDPGNLDVRAKLDALTPRVNPKIERLERWLSKVSRREVRDV
ncbi:MAG TPA: tetratricopeptide repeat protein [Thermoanaerobaculia bacterium]|nr:tetratricopeptide repeat protein [Thermoanaerobaculia bacterium]